MFTSLGDQVPQTISGDHIVSHFRSQDHCPPAKPTLESISIIIGCVPSARFSLSTRMHACSQYIFGRLHIASWVGKPVDVVHRHGPPDGSGWNGIWIKDNVDERPVK